MLDTKTFHEQIRSILDPTVESDYIVLAKCFEIYSGPKAIDNMSLFYRLLQLQYFSNVLSRYIYNPMFYADYKNKFNEFLAVSPSECYKIFQSISEENLRYALNDLGISEQYKCEIEDALNNNDEERFIHSISASGCSLGSIRHLTQSWCEAWPSFRDLLNHTIFKPYFTIAQAIIKRMPLYSDDIETTKIYATARKMFHSAWSLKNQNIVSPEEKETYIHKIIDSIPERFSEQFPLYFYYGRTIVDFKVDPIITEVFEKITNRHEVSEYCKELNEAYEKMVTDEESEDQSEERANVQNTQTLTRDDFYCGCIYSLPELEKVYRILLKKELIEESADSHEAFLLRFSRSSQYLHCKDVKIRWKGTNDELSAFISNMIKEDGRFFKKTERFFVLLDFVGKEIPYNKYDASKRAISRSSERFIDSLGLPRQQ